MRTSPSTPVFFRFCLSLFASLILAGCTTTPVTPFSGDLSNTRWIGQDSDGDEYLYHFKPNGELEYTSPTGQWYLASWRIEKDKIHMETNNGYSVYSGDIDGTRMSGKAQNQNGYQWSWRATLVE